MSNLLIPEAGSIWLPGAGLVPAHIREAQSAVEDYDTDLGLGRDEMTGDWVVLWKHGPGGQPFPVYNLGPELPNRDTIQKKLYHADIRRRGSKIVHDVERRNEARRKEMRHATTEAAGEVAEAMDTAFHVMKRHPAPRIIVPKTYRKKDG